MSPRRLSLAAASAAALACGCAPDLGAPPSDVRDERVLAVIADAPETAPGESTTYRVVVASPAGPVAADGARWTFCHAPKPLAETESVPADCVDDRAALLPIGRGASATAATPGDACALFGSALPPGATNVRPRDPDATGGYDQPVRVEFDGLVAFGLERIECDLANAPQAQATKWLHEYVPNRNPSVASFSLERGGAAVGGSVPAGAALTARVTWPASSKETYAWYDAERARVTKRREALDVAWYATRGAFAEDRTGRSESDDATSTEVAWTAPASAGRVFLWAVLRDSRGGSDVAELTVDVE